MDTARIHSTPFALAFVAVFLIETALQRMGVGIEPLVVTGIARMFDILAILGIFTLYGQVFALGLSRKAILPGITKGILWSVGFAGIAGLIGVCLVAAGINPLRWIHVHTPDQPWRIVLFYLVGSALGPVAEELFFRGMVYGYLKGLLRRCLKPAWAIGTAVAASTLFFATAHSGASGLPLIQVIGGIVFCLSYEHGKSLSTPIVIHFLGNAALFSLSLITRHFF